MISHVQKWILVCVFRMIRLNVTFILLLFLFLFPFPCASGSVSVLIPYIYKAYFAENVPNFVLNVCKLMHVHWDTTKYAKFQSILRAFDFSLFVVHFFLVVRKAYPWKWLKTLDNLYSWYVRFCIVYICVYIYIFGYFMYNIVLTAFDVFDAYVNRGL